MTPRRMIEHDLIIIRIREANPEMTLREIGKKVGVSPERIRQILKRNNVPTARVKKR
jgi:DNA-directed RNA polymerase sigma subunit (sigma70/sigma32)